MRKPHLIFMLLCAVSLSFAAASLNFAQTPSEDKRDSESTRRLNKDEAIARLRSDAAQRRNLVVSFEASVPATTLKKTLAQRRVQQVQAFYQWGNHRGGYGVREAQTLQESLTDFENRHLQFLQRQIQNLSNSTMPAVVKLDVRHVLEMERARQELLEEFQAQLELFNQKGLLISRLVAEDSPENLISLVEAFSADGVGFQVDEIVHKTKETLKGDAPERLTAPTTAAANPPYPNDPWKFSPARGRIIYDKNTKILSSFFSWDDTSGFDSTHIAYEHDIVIFEEKDSYVEPDEGTEWHSNLPDDPDPNPEKHSKESTRYHENRFMDKYTTFSMGTAAARSLKVGSLYFIEVPLKVNNENGGPAQGSVQPQLGSWAGEYDDGDSPDETKERAFCTTQNLPLQNAFANCIFDDQTHNIVNYFNDSGVFVNFPFDHRVSATFHWDRAFAETPPEITCPDGMFKADYWRWDREDPNKPRKILVMRRCETSPINHDWGTGQPELYPQSDDFEVEWTGRFSFPAGNHRFIASSDDGIRVFVDGAVLPGLDHWENRSETENRAEKDMSSGLHTIKVQYYEAAGNAVARLRWELIGGSNTCQASVAADRWKGEYFNNPTLSGTPVMVRDDSDVAGGTFFAHNWGTGSPNAGCGVGVDNFSARWTRRQNFDAGRYSFTVRADDGVRFFVDNVLRIDQWRDQGATSYTVDVDLTAGNHDLRVEYYEHGANAVAQIFWQRAGGNVAPTITKATFNTPIAGQPFGGTIIGTGFVVSGTEVWFCPTNGSNCLQHPAAGVTVDTPTTLRVFNVRLSNGTWQVFVKTAAGSSAHSAPFTVMLAPATCIATVASDRWKGEYFNNRDLSGAPAMVRDDSDVAGGSFFAHDWASGSPNIGCGMAADDFSVRWTRRQSFGAGRYRFTVRADDGVRLFVDNVLRIDQWRDQGATNYTVEFDLTSGNHDLRMEYYEHSGNASAQIFWDRTDGGVPNSCVSTVALDRWKGEYYNNRFLTGTPVMVRDDSDVGGGTFFAHDWGTGSPNAGCGVAVDDFSARWTRQQSFAAGRYSFTVRADDGVRLFVDNVLRIDQWRDQGATNYTAEFDLSSGNHDLRMEYYEHGGNASAQIFWTRVGAGAIPTIGGFTLTPNPPTANQNFNGSVTGTNFLVGGTELWFCPLNSNSCVQHPPAGVTVNNSGSLNFVNVKLSGGTWQFFVKTAGGQSARSSSFNVQSGASVPTIGGFTLTPNPPTANQNFNGSVTGTNFVVGATELWFCPLNSNSCVQHPPAGVTVNSAGSLSFVNVKLSSGSWQFFVKTAGGQSARSSSFNVQAGGAVPTIGGFTLTPNPPTAGQNFNGSASGSNFVVGATELWFCPVNSNSCVQHPAAGVTVNSSTSLSFVNVKLGSGSWQFFVKTAAGQSARSGSFNVQPGAPTISSFSVSPNPPTAGQNFNGSASGSNFVGGGTELWFCPVNSSSCVQHPSAGVTVNSSTSLSFVNVKLGSGSWQFFVKTSAGQSSRSGSFNVQAGAPTISSFSVSPNPPTAGQNFNGSASGSNFVGGATELWFCPVNSNSCVQHPSAGVTVNSSTSLSFVNVKLGSGSWQFFVKTAAGQSARSGSFNVQAGAPTISSFSVSPNPPTAGQNFNGSASGSNFVAGATELWFCPVNSSSCVQHPSAGVTVNSSTSLSFVNVKLGSGSWQFFVKTSAGQSSRSGSFNVQPGAPTISSFSVSPNPPTAGQNFDGSASGSNFVAGATELWFCPVNSSSCVQHPSAGVTVNSSTSLSFVNVKLGSGSWQFFVKTAAGQSARSGSFNVQAGAPTISSFSVSPNPPTAGQNFNGSASGSNFVGGGTELWFCPVNSSSCVQHPSVGVTVNNSSSLSFVNVRLSSGLWQFFLRTSAGQSARSGSFSVQ